MEDLKQELEQHLSEAVRIFAEVTRLRVRQLVVTPEGKVPVLVDLAGGLSVDEQRTN